MSKNGKMGQKIWAAFGKFSAVVVLIATILGICRAVLPPGPRLEVRAEYNSFALPPDVAAALDNAATRTSESYLYEQLSRMDDPNTTERYTAARISAYAKGISRILDHNSLADYVWPLNRYKGFVCLVVRNAGNLPATDVVLDTPLDGLALVTSADDSEMTLTFNKRLSLGELRAKEWKRLAIWSKRDMLDHYTKDFRISCSQGTGSIAFGRTVYGVWRFLANVDLFLWFWFLVLPASCVPLLIHVYRHFAEHTIAIRDSVGESEEGKAAPSANLAQREQNGDGSRAADQTPN